MQNKKPLNEMNMYDFCDKYYSDIEGNVYFNKTRFKSKIGKKVKHFINKYGYVEYILSNKYNIRKHIQAHRIVACLFIPNPNNKLYVNHKDGNKLNNTISNLEWVTSSENERHSHQVLNKKPWNLGKELPKGKEYKGKIRPVASYTLDGKLLKTYFNPTEAEQDGFNLKHISAVCCGSQKTHKGLKWQYIIES